MFGARTSGIICHPTSLPGPHGVGDLGPAAWSFVDFLAECGQGLWQVLPLGPTGHGNSPYMAWSAFGANPLLVSLDLLAEEGLLERRDLEHPPSFPAHRVDYGAAWAWRLPLLRRAWDAFRGDGGGLHGPDWFTFSERNAFWLEDQALFKALKDAHGGRMWVEWEPGAARRDPEALLRWRNELAEEIRFQKFLQYAFFRQWEALRDQARRRGVRIFGDLPIYVAYDSAEVWSRPEMFQLDEDLRPVAVSGVPPDYFSATGQRWGNPLYRWEAMAEDGYSWWVDRFRANFALTDLVRLDHFRGFEGFWEVPASEETAMNGRWVKGPGVPFFERVRSAVEALGIPFHVVAEDLGVITPEVDAMRDHLGFPGMRILQMAFGSDPKAGEFRPHNYPRNCVVYTGSHDNDTTVGWYRAEPGSGSTQSREEVEQERDFLRRYLPSDGREIHWDLIRLALRAVSWAAIFPIQDVMGLGSEARMNRPGTGEGNWEWRFSGEMLNHGIADRLRELTRIYDRGSIPPPEP